MVVRTWVVCFLAVLGCRAEPAGSLVHASAESELHRFLSAIPAGQEADFGFDNRAELERATVGSAFRMALPDAAGEPMLLDVWRVPVVVDGEYRALLTVKLHDGDMRATGLGAAKLARELERVEGDVLLRVPARGVDFVLGGERAWPLRSARRALRLEEGPFSVDELRPLVRASR